MLSQKLLNLLNKHLGLDHDQATRRYLIKGTSGTFLIYVGTTVLTFILALVLARILGAEEYGRYTYVFTWIAVLATAGMAGADDLMLKELPRYGASGENRKMKGLLRFAPVVVLVFTFLLGGLFWLYARQSASPDFSRNISLFRWAVIALPFFTITLWLQSAMKGKQHVLSGQFPQKVGRPITLLVLLGIAVIIFGRNINATLAVQLTVLSYLAMFAMALLLFHRKLSPLFFRKKRAVFEIRPWAKNMFYFFLLSLTNVLNGRIDVILMGRLGYLGEVGIYNVALKLSEFLLFSMLIVNTVLAPLFSKYYSAGQLELLQKLITKGTRIMFFLALPPTLIFVLAGPWLLMIFGEGFEGGYWPLVVLSIGQLFYLFVGPAAYVLMMTGFGKEVFWGLLVSLGVTVALDLLLIPRYGQVGAAWGRAVGLVVGHLIYAVVLYKKTGLLATVKVPGKFICQVFLNHKRNKREQKKGL